MKFDRGTLDSALLADFVTLLDIANESRFSRGSAPATAPCGALAGTPILFPLAGACRLSKFRGFFAPA